MLKLSVVSQEKSFFSGDVSRVVLPGSEGSFEILTNHTPFMSTLTLGTILIYPVKGEPMAICIDAGIAHIRENTISIIVDSAYEARINQQERLQAEQDSFRKKLQNPQKADYFALLKQLSQITSELQAINRIKKHKNKL